MNKKSLLNFSYNNRIKEDNLYNTDLYAISMFSYNNIYMKNKIKKGVLNFSFKDINFNKKRALPFFLAMEFLTNQKCIATLSSKNILQWKIRKKMLVGCKVTLRKNSMENFIENLLLALPRMEKFKPFPYTMLESQNKSAFSLIFYEMLYFYPIEWGFGINTNFKKINLTILLKNFSREEKLFMLNAYKIPFNI